MTKEFCDICGRPIETQPDRKIMTKRRGRPPKNEKRNDSFSFSDKDTGVLVVGKKKKESISMVAAALRVSVPLWLTISIVLFEARLRSGRKMELSIS